MPKRKFAMTTTRSVRRRRSGIRPRIGRTSRRINLNRSRMNTQLHKFSRWCTNGNNPEGSFTADCTTVSTSINPVAKFAYLANYTEFTNLYDQYKITRVVYHVQLINNPDAGNIVNSTTAGNNSSNWFPKLWYVRDYDDNTSMTLDEMRQYSKSKCITLRPNQTYKIAVKPAVLLQAYDTAISSAYIPKWNQWVDAANSATPHYGIKFLVDTFNIDPSDTAPFKVRFDVKYYFLCKTPR